MREASLRSTESPRLGAWGNAGSMMRRRWFVYWAIQLILAHHMWALGAESTDSLQQAIPSCQKIALLKSLKTGSTTFANILFRAGAARGMKVMRQEEGQGLDFAVNYTLPVTGTVDMVLSHIKGGCVKPGEYPQLLKFYEQVSRCRVMREEVGLRLLPPHGATPGGRCMCVHAHQAALLLRSPTVSCLLYPTPTQTQIAHPGCWVSSAPT